MPAASLEMGLPDDGSQPTSTTQRKAYDLLSDGFGPGFNGPLMVVVDGKGAQDGQGAKAAPRGSQGDRRARRRRRRHPGDVQQGRRHGDAHASSRSPSPAASRPRTWCTPSGTRRDGITSDTGADVLVTGTTAMNIDVSQKLNDALLPYLALVVGLAFLLLMVVFRSVLVPLKAALGFLLSVVAALGAVVAVFQWGWLARCSASSRPGRS